MVSLQAVRAHNASLKNLGPGLVAVFVGGTSGIGETTAREFVRHTVEPRVYLVGRNKAEASRIIDELAKLNPDGTVNFIQTDASLLRSVDKACDEIKEKEEKINVLFLSPGIMTTKGRQETEEGLDRKLNLHYYSRMRFATNLLPLLTKAAHSTPNLSRVVSVLSGGYEAKMNLEDPALKNTFTLSACANHAITMNTLAAEQLASKYPDTSFIHASPGAVETRLHRDFGSLASVGLKFAFILARPWVTPILESGERHLFAATSMQYPPRSMKSVDDTEQGINGVKGSGAYSISANGSYAQNEKVVQEYRSQGVGERIWEHTLDVFEKVCGTGGGKY